MQRQAPLHTTKKLRHVLLRIAMYLGILLLLLIPSYLAIANYMLGQNAPAEDGRVIYTSFDMTGPGGTYRECDTCDICSSLLCADCLRECCGGDLIRCC